MVAADNVVYPGAPGYLEYVGGASYETQMVEAKFEYDQKCEDIPSPKPPECLRFRHGEEL
jgi:hypothetical protein